MAEPKPAETNPSAATEPEAPKLKAVTESAPEPAPAPGPAEPERSGISRGWFALVVVLLALAIAGLLAQGRHAAAQADRIASLEGQVEGLTVQLSAANTRLADYDMQVSVIRELAADVYQKMGNLLQVAEMGPLEENEPVETPPAP